MEAGPTTEGEQARKEALNKKAEMNQTPPWATNGPSHRAVRGDTQCNRAQSCPVFGTRRGRGVSITRHHQGTRTSTCPPLTKHTRERPLVESCQYLQQAGPSTPRTVTRRADAQGTDPSCNTARCKVRQLSFPSPLRKYVYSRLSRGRMQPSTIFQTP